MNYKTIILILIVLLNNEILKGQTIFTDDYKIAQELKRQLQELAQDSKNVSYADLQAQLKDKSCKLQLKNKAKNKKLKKADLFKQIKKSTFIIGKLFKQENSGKEFVYKASCFAIHENGIFVTNHHVFEDNKFGYSSLGIIDDKGNFYRVKEIIASSNMDDLAIFKIEANGI